MLMVGPPGAGKSMLAARLPGLLPPLDPSEALEVSMIHSLSGVHVLRPPEDDTTATHRHPWWAGYRPAVDQTTINHGPPAS